MKYLIATVVFIVLFILPIGSWYYLQSGLDYRKDALIELEAKGEFLNGLIAKDLLESKTTLIHLSDLDNKEVIPELYDQYKGAKSFQLYSITKPQQENQKWEVLTSIEAQRISSQYENAGFVLLDTAMQVRNIYPKGMDPVSKVIEHISIVLPRVKEMDVKLKK